MSTATTQAKLSPYSDREIAVPLGYKQTEVGVIPVDWTIITLGNVIDLLTGFPFPSSGYTDSGVLLVRGSNVKRGKLDWDDEITKYWPSVTPDIARYELREGDLVVAMDGALVGRSYAVIGAADLPSLLLQRVARLRSAKVHQGLLTCWIASDSFVQHVDSVKTHTAIPHISPTDIRIFTVVIPTNRDEQRAITAALSDVDELIGALAKLIAKKRAMKQAAMQQLLTGKTRLPGFESNRSRKLTDVGEIPDDWRVRRLNQCLRRAPDYGINAPAVSYDDALQTYLRITDIDEDGRFKPSPKVSVHNPNANRYLLAEGDLVFARTGASVGKSYPYRPHDGLLVFAGFLIRVTPDPRILDARFLAHYVQAKKYWDWVSTMSARSGQPGINGREYGQLQLPLPDLTEQHAIAAVISEMDAEIETLEKRRDKTKAIKQGMMQALLTGRVRLVTPPKAEAKA